MSSASVAFGAVDPMCLFTGAKWRSIRIVKHSAWPASASLIRVLSSNVVIDAVMEVSVVPNCRRFKRPACCLMRSAKYLANNSHSFPLLPDEDLREMKTVSLDDIRAVCEQRGSECQVSLSGRITIDSSPDLRAVLLSQLESSSCQILTADFREVDYIDTSGLALLVEVLKAARTQGKAFHLSGLRERPRYLLEATRLLHLFEGAQ